MKLKTATELIDSQNLLNDVNQFYNRITFDIKQSEKDRLNGAIMASMGAGNPKGTRLTPNSELKNAIHSVLKELLTEICKTDLSIEKYDDLFSKTLEKLAAVSKEKDSDCWMTFGRLQKIINIYVKYYITLTLLKENDRDFEPYEKLIPVAHIPIDRIVLHWFSLKKNNPDEEGRKLIKCIGSWKKNLTLEKYRQIQEIARKVSGQHGLTPFELEMKIWLENI